MEEDDKKEKCKFCQANLKGNAKVCWQCGKILTKDEPYCIYCADKKTIGDFPACETHLALYIISHKLEKISGSIAGLRKDMRGSMQRLDEAIRLGKKKDKK